MQDVIWAKTLCFLSRTSNNHINSYENTVPAQSNQSFWGSTEIRCGDYDHVHPLSVLFVKDVNWTKPLCFHSRTSNNHTTSYENTVPAQSNQSFWGSAEIRCGDYDHVHPLSVFFCQRRNMSETLCFHSRTSNNHTKSYENTMPAQSNQYFWGSTEILVCEEADNIYAAGWEPRTAHVLLGGRRNYVTDIWGSVVTSYS